MWNPFIDFPREMGFQLRTGLVWNMKELVSKINKYNAKTDVFTSLYSFEEVNEKKTRGIYGSARIKHIYFDLDKPKIDPIKSFHDYCMEKNYKHTIIFSGNGFHIYISTYYPNNLKNKKGAVTNSQIQIADDIGLSIGINGGFDIDGHIIGNIAQLVRLPGSFNLKRKKYCIPINKEDLETDIETIQKKSSKQRFGLYIYGEKSLDLGPFDTEPQTKQYDLELLLDAGKGIGLDKIDISTFPPCIQKLTTERFLKHHGRFIFIIYCKELGISIRDTVSLLKKFLEPQTFFHCIRIEKQPMWVYRKSSLFFPSCEKLRREGWCTDPKCEGAKL